jgi:hypothetical protein
MREPNKTRLTIVDILVGMAVLLVLSGLFVPYFVKPGKTAVAAPVAHQITR